jgi:cytochrome c biogenesis protein CcmG/thiol:disulfide interchange protein DsbE
VAEPDRTERSDLAGDEPASAAHHSTPPAVSSADGHAHRRGRWIVVATVAVSVSLISALLAFGLSRDPSVIRSPLLGRPAPDFALRTLQGGPRIRLSGFRGRVVVINFWASWCAACREEHPALIAAWERYRDQGVVMLGIDYQDRVPDALAFVREMGGDWPIVQDPGGRVALSYGVYGVPETFFIDQKGIVAYKRIGASSYELLTDQIQRLLDRRRSS